MTLTAPARRPRWKRKPWAAALALWLVLPIGYAAGYRSLMRPRAVLWTGWPARTVVNATYPHPALVRVFAPAEWVDRRARPGLWYR
jgi:hypothetical protein